MPLIAPEKNVVELSLRCILLAILLTLVLAMSNAYLALKLGILTSASIPAAIISMGILRLFKNPSILENNAVQTAASAGEAVAGGIVYTIPALIIIGYWHHFDYFTNFFIAATGGVLGVLFSIPLRRILVNEEKLKFPEGRAIAEVLKTSAERYGLKNIVVGGLVGAVLELFQMGFKILASSWNYWFVVQRSIFGFGIGFSATMIGAGYLIGQDIALSIFIGALLSWVVAFPVVSRFYPEILAKFPVEKAAHLLWNSEMRYLGIGAMLFAGIWTMLTLIKPLVSSIRVSMRAFISRYGTADVIPRTEKDIPVPYILIGIFGTAAFMFLFFQFLFPLSAVGLDNDYAPTVVFSAVLYVVIVGFFFSVITAYFSGMVGVTASPGSSIVIAGILFAAWLLLGVIKVVLPLPLSEMQLKAAEAITIMIGSVVTGIAAIANDNIQDLKVGQLVGATPWKQQVMLLLGVLVSALIIPPVMQLLFDVYGIGGVMPRDNMDVSQSLPAPTAAMLAAVTEAVFRNTLPWFMMLVGAAIILAMIVINRLFNLKRYFQLSILGVAIGMYLPISSSFPLFLGGLIAMMVDWRLKRQGLNKEKRMLRIQIGTLIACGLVAGAALMDVVLAIPFSVFQSPDVLRLVGAGWAPFSVLLSLIVTVLLALWINQKVCQSPEGKEGGKT